MPWAKILDNCKARLHFFQRELRLESSAEQSIEYLKSIYSNYICEIATRENICDDDMKTDASDSPNLKVT